MRIAAIALLVSSLPSAVSAADAPIAVKYLRCEYLVNPLGIDAAAPSLSWVLESPQRSVMQGAYQVLVASSPERLANDEGDLWDSGKVASGRSTHVAYGGKPLASRLQCHWKVRVWDGRGAPSTWSEPAFWTMGLLERADWKARWIGGEIPESAQPRSAYLPAPHVRKVFAVKDQVRRAVIYATAAGLYELWINGSRVGNDYFTPGWTEYAKRLYYQTYDVTRLIQGNRRNVIGATLGDGWYGLHHGGRGCLRLLAQLEIEYADGSSETIATDTTWQSTSGGPILSSDLYNGESYDARKEMPGWSAPGCNDLGWSRAIEDGAARGTWADVTEKVRAAVKGDSLEIKASNENFGDPIYGTPKSLKVEFTAGASKEMKTVPEGSMLSIKAPANASIEILKAVYGADAVQADVRKAALTAYPGVPVRKTEELKPVDRKEPKPGIFVFNMGQNFAGWARLRVRGEAGAKVTLRFAEMLNPDGTIYTTNLRGAKSTDTYVLRGGGEEIWEPRFTFHGFQYVEVTGYPGTPPLDAITGIVLHSDAPVVSTFQCSNPMLNKLCKNIVWGQRSNYFEVPTDCPQRDERMGWTGDAQAFIGTGLYNQDLGAFFRSWIITLNDSQRADGGYTDVSPRGGGVSAGWSDAGVVCPWTLWRVYGDTAVIEKHFDGMMRWIEHCEKNSKGLLRPAEGYGDWLNVGAELPKDVIATAYFARSTHLLAQMARAIGRNNEAARLDALFQRIAAAFNNAYVSADGRVKGDTQTAYLMALAFDLLPADKRETAAKYLIQRIEERRWHLSTGFLGVNLLLPTLTSIGRVDVAYRLLQNETYPSWGYPVRHGATTIWERWDGWTEERGFQDPGMNSFNHYAYGSCGQWMFATMAGIDTDGPGFERCTIRPRVGGGLTHVAATYDSIRGRIATSWKIEGAMLALAVTIPANTLATVFVPADDATAVTEGGKPAAEAAGVKFLRSEPGASVFQIGSGTYEFRSHLPREIK
jgi:alpha-L-rhamnosidase